MRIESAVRKETTMKRYALGVIVSSLMATALVSAQNPPAAAADQGEKMKEVTVTGCLIRGSAPTVFLLDDARVDPKNKSEKPQAFVLTASESVLRVHVNHEVQVSGEAETKAVPTPPPGQKVAERDLPKLKVKSIAAVADRCTAVQ
jgi:hypothetical protein